MLDGHGVFNDNFHWTAYDSTRCMHILCGFDFETECFSIFSSPPHPGVVPQEELNVLGDCLCYSYTWDNEIVIWLIKEYQVEESWTEVYKLRTTGFVCKLFSVWGAYTLVYPIKVFKDSDVLMLLGQRRLIYYYNKTSTTQNYFYSTKQVLLIILLP